MLFILAILPPLIAAFWFYKKDKNPEPFLHSITAIFSGCLVCLPVLLVVIFIIEPILGDLFYQNILISSFISAFFFAAIPEEFFKYIFLYIYIKSKHCDEPYDMIFYGAMISIGFALIENIFYVYEGGLSVALLRAFSAVPLHAICGAFMGYGLFKSINLNIKNNYFSFFVIKSSLLLPVIFHGLYNLPLFAMNNDQISRQGISLALILWFIIIFYFVNKFRLIMKEIILKS